MASIGTEFPEEQKRLRELLEEYQRLPIQSGFFGVSMIKATLTNAEKAMASGDVVEILKAFQEMQKITG